MGWVRVHVLICWLGAQLVTTILWMERHPEDSRFDAVAAGFVWPVAVAVTAFSMDRS